MYIKWGYDNELLLMTIEHNGIYIIMPYEFIRNFLNHELHYTDLMEVPSCLVLDLMIWESKLEKL